MQTALTLGLALQVHHDVGSMYLVDVLHNLGHCVSYDEVRRFTTSVAKLDQISQAGDDYVPRGIQSVDLANADTFVDAAMDNFDQNEETSAGKTTTLPWLPSSTKDVEPSMLMKAFREQGGRHWMSQHILYMRYYCLYTAKIKATAMASHQTCHCSLCRGNEHDVHHGI